MRFLHTIHKEVKRFPAGTSFKVLILMNVGIIKDVRDFGSV